MTGGQTDSTVFAMRMNSDKNLSQVTNGTGLEKTKSQINSQVPPSRHSGESSGGDTVEMRGAPNIWQRNAWTEILQSKEYKRE